MLLKSARVRRSPFRVARSFPAEIESPRFLLGKAGAGCDKEEAQASTKIEFGRPHGVRCLLHQLPHFPPVLNRLHEVAPGRPSRGPIVPVASFQRLAARFPVLRKERGFLVEPVAIQIGDRARHFGVDTLAPLAEQRAVRRPPESARA